MAESSSTIRQLAETVAAATDRPVKSAEEIIWATFDAIAHKLARRETFSVANFGTFKAVERPARKARNPQTGEGVDVPPTYEARFRPTGRLREMVRDGAPSGTIRKRGKGEAGGPSH